MWKGLCMVSKDSTLALCITICIVLGHVKVIWNRHRELIIASTLNPCLTLKGVPSLFGAMTKLDNWWDGTKVGCLVMCYSQCFAGILSNFCFSQNWTTFEVKSHGTFLLKAIKPLQVQSDQTHTVFIKKDELTSRILSEFNGADENAYHSPLKWPLRYIKLYLLHNMMVMQYD